MSSTAKGFLLVLAFAVVGGHVGVGYIADSGRTARTGAGAQVITGPGAGDGIEGPTDIGGDPGDLGDTQAVVGDGKKGRQTVANLQCAAGRNGGDTAPGVSGKEIKLATTAVQDGAAASLLQPAIVGMRAVLDKVNAKGGICGRRLALTLNNDSFDAPRGQQYIENYIAQGYFALPVVPSAEGLSAAIQSRSIGRAGIPVIGTDGMRIEQYSEPWVWPVGTATVSTMRIMASYGYKVRNARTFGIVYDSKYKFGIEGKDAFVAQVKKMGGEVRAEQPLNPDDPSYGPQDQDFKTKCGTNADKKCDMVAMLLLPDTAKKWFQLQPVIGKLITSGAQTLFTDKFAQDCVRVAKDLCADFVVWTGYNPPLDRFKSLPGIAQYIDDVSTISPSADLTNQFLQGAYFGMTLFAEALKQVGPNLTRARLKETLDAMDYTSDFASKLIWRPSKHFANIRAQAFSLVYASGSAVGWRDEQTGFVLDPAFGG